MPILIWAGIIVCLSQSAILSGLNLGLFTLSRLELQVQAKKGDPRARKVLRLREDANFMLVTILWGNVAVNVLLALLSGSVLSGLTAFLFSTVVITVFAEIVPQSYFSRHALVMASALSPVLRFYQIILYPVARSTAWILDKWLGGEQVRFFPERDLRRLIQLHMEASESDIAHVEGQGALNFLAIDDIPLDNEGEPVDRSSIVQLHFEDNLPQFPEISADVEDRFLQAINKSGRSWIVIVDAEEEPRLLLRANNFLREALFAPERLDPLRHCCRPIVVRSADHHLGDYLSRIRVTPGTHASDQVKNTAILLWGENPRILSGTDIMDRLLKGITGIRRLTGEENPSINAI